MPTKKEVVKTVSVFACDYCSFEGTEKETANHEVLKHKIKIVNLCKDKKLYWFNSIKEYKLYCRSTSSQFNSTAGDSLPGWLVVWGGYCAQFTPAETFLKNTAVDINKLEETLKNLKEVEFKIKNCI